jgi:glutamine synthetase
LKSILHKAKKKGLIPIYGSDLEWFNFRKTPNEGISGEALQENTMTKGMFGYSLVRLFENQQFFTDIINVSNKAGIPIEGFHTETGPGVVEASVMKSLALRTADNISLFKTIIKNIAHKNDLVASFMAKWNQNLPGCSMHFHHSFDNQSEQFFGYGKDHKLNKFTKHFLAGQLKLLPYLLPFYAPTVNSYKRFMPGSWAPTKICWGTENRTTAIRVIPESETTLRLENRVAGADANPYLVITASLASGLYGVENELELEIDECANNAYQHSEYTRLAPNLKEATKLMEGSIEVKKIFGDAFINHFAQTRHLEWEKFEHSVTDWELKRYFEII